MPRSSAAKTTKAIVARSTVGLRWPPRRPAGWRATRRSWRSGCARDGRVIPRHHERRRGDCGEVIRPSRDAGANIGPETCCAVSGGVGFSYHMAVEGLLVGAGLLMFGPNGAYSPARDGVSAETPSVT